jgi:Tol biopolymer transport system component
MILLCPSQKAAQFISLLFVKAEKGSLDIWRSRFVNGKYTLPENLEEINTEHYEDGPFIAPDESYLIFESERPGGIGGSIDLYISFRKDDGSWSVPVNMGETINSDKTDRWARVTPDGKYLFFGSNRNGNMDIYWIDAKIISNLKTGQ